MRQARRDKLLSAYIDNELSPREQVRLQQRLATDPELQEELDALRQTVALVQNLPTVPIPHNFILTPESVGEAKPRQVQRGSKWTALLLTAATTVASLLFVLVLAMSILPGNMGMGTTALAPAPAMDLQKEAPRVAAVEEAEELALEKAEMPVEQIEAEEEITPQESFSGEEASEDSITAEVEAAPLAEMPAADEEQSAGVPILSVEATEPSRQLPTTEPSLATPAPYVARAEGNQTSSAPKIQGGALSSSEAPVPDEVATGPASPTSEPTLTSRGIPLTVLQIVLGIGVLVLVSLTIRAWRSQRR